MRSKLWWFTSAALLCAGIWFVGLVAMTFASLEYLFDAKDSAAVMSAGAQAMILSSLGLAFASLVATVIALDRLRARRVCVEIGIQCFAILFGSLFAWTLSEDPLWLLAWAPLYVFAFYKPFVHEARGDDPDWKRFGLVGLSAVSAAFILAIGHL